MIIKILDREIGENKQTYFIADIAANHDGDLDRAKMLVKLAKESGANAVKFQNHRVQYYVSKKGFESLGGKFSHQEKWNKSVFDVYKDAQIPINWSLELKSYCDYLGIHYFSTPYDLEMVDLLNSYVPAFKIGSGDINWPDMLIKVANKNKPVILSTGASTIGEVQKAVNTLLSINKNLILMQCNTNYTGSLDNFNYVHLNVLKAYKQIFPGLVLGLSDHTPGHATVLGAVALGAKVIEKHFTDDTTRNGPDHPFSMTPQTWKEMVDRTRELEKAMGSPEKKVEANEQQTIILQRRCIRATRDIKKGEKITESMMEFQRPAPTGSFEPNFKSFILGRLASKNIKKEDYFHFDNIGGIL